MRCESVQYQALPFLYCSIMVDDPLRGGIYHSLAIWILAHMINNLLFRELTGPQNCCIPLFIGF